MRPPSEESDQKGGSQNHGLLKFKESDVLKWQRLVWRRNEPSSYGTVYGTEEVPVGFSVTSEGYLD